MLSSFTSEKNHVSLLFTNEEQKKIGSRHLLVPSAETASCMQSLKFVEHSSSCIVTLQQWRAEKDWL